MVIEMKPCKDCKQVLPLSEYYAHPMMADGHLNKCKECVKARVRKHRLANLESIQDYDRERGRTDKRRAAVAERQPGYRRMNPEKYKARSAVANALRAGRIFRNPCEKCGAEERVEAHHEDYSKPLDVRWLCSRCHGAEHRKELTTNRAQNRL